MGKRKILICALAVAAMMSLFMGRPSKAFPEPEKKRGKKSRTLASDSSSWERSLDFTLTELDKKYPGHFGVFVRHLASGRELSFRGDEPWYIASGAKVPVAIEALAQAEQGKLDLERKVVLREEDKLDGAEIVNRFPAGTELSLRYLLEQMIIHSDNTASDLVIREAGIASVNRQAQRLAPSGFGELTSLSGVRSLAYGEFHPEAARLTNADFLTLKAEPEATRVRKLAELLGVAESELRFSDLQAGFEAYYARGWNSATLRGYTDLLEQVVSGRALNEETTAYLLGVMERTATGKARVRQGLGERFTWAHKTGTQQRRVCDFGIAWPKNDPANRVLISACTRRVTNFSESESLLASIGAAVARSGIF